MKLLTYLLLLSIVSTSLFTFSATPTFAQNEKKCKSIESGVTIQSGGFFKNVSCQCIERGACSLTDFISVVFEISETVFAAAGVIALIFFIAGGVFLLISGGNQTFIQRGKQILRSALIGLVIIFLSWILVNTIVWGLTGNSDGTIFQSDRWYIFRSEKR